MRQIKISSRRALVQRGPATRLAGAASKAEMNKRTLEIWTVSCPASLRWMAGLFLVFLFGLVTRPAQAQVTIAQLSDTHLGEQHSPHAADNLRRAVDMINSRHPDAVVLSGDIGENPGEWDKAKSILKNLKAPIYYAPGNHDVHSHDVDRYRGAFGKDYYRFQVKNVTFLVIDSQLLGNYDQFDARPLPPLPSQMEQESEKMLDWLSNQGGGDHGHDRHDRDRGLDRDRDRDNDRDDRGQGIIIGIQHIPVFRDGNFPSDSKPYWVVNDPYRSREMDILHKLGVKHMLVGHWHNGRVFQHDGITWHVGDATSWLPMGGELGFAMHTISRDGDVRTEFVPLGTQP
jgi:3',5'-cyclic AMP phosphodiesterase CpdA